MPFWEIVIVALILLAAAGWLLWYYLSPKKRRQAKSCSGDCAHCPFVDGDCLDPVLRDRLSHEMRQEDSDKKDEA